MSMVAEPPGVASTVSSRWAMNGASVLRMRSFMSSRVRRWRVGRPSVSTLISCSRPVSTSSRLRPVAVAALSRATSACSMRTLRTSPIASYRTSEIIVVPTRCAWTQSRCSVKASSGRACPSPVSVTRRATSWSSMVSPASRAGSLTTRRSISWRNGRIASVRIGSPTCVVSSTSRPRYSERRVATTRTGPALAAASTARNSFLLSGLARTSSSSAWSMMTSSRGAVRAAARSARVTSTIASGLASWLVSWLLSQFNP